MRLTLFQRLHLWVFGWAETGRLITKLGWSGSLPTYYIVCKVHGLVENTAAGWWETISCPRCDRSVNKRISVLSEFP